MTVAYCPTAKLCRLNAAWLLTLPLAAAFYAAMTLDSAIRYRRGTDGRWNGRIFSPQ
jgi:hypothetical protein